ncbi:MAG: hypothetical protein F9K17_11900, partial [Phycisphaerae bacterium]
MIRRCGVNLLGASATVSPGQILRILVVIGFLVALLILLIVGSGLLMRWGRRLTRDSEARRPPPTDSSDVWSMHTVPESTWRGEGNDDRSKPAHNDLNDPSSGDGGGYDGGDGAGG